MRSDPGRPLGMGDPERIGGHAVRSVLGEGGQGVVYFAETPDGASVAIKVLHGHIARDPAVQRRFLREAEIAREVATFCTARVLEVGVEGDRPYLVSEYIPGISLQEFLRTTGPSTGSSLERLAVTTLTALAAIHRAGIVHRDFKPANVILGPEGPVVIDFGIARVLEQTTIHSGVLGTPAFMAPEQFSSGMADPACDIFSWAVTMAYAASGRLPFAGDTPPVVMHAILTREPDLSGVPESLAATLAACLGKDPARRPRADELLRHFTGLEVLPPPAKQAQRAKQPERAERAEPTDQADQAGRTGRAEPVERVERVEWAERVERTRPVRRTKAAPFILAAGAQVIVGVATLIVAHSDYNRPPVHPWSPILWIPTMLWVALGAALLAVRLAARRKRAAVAGPVSDRAEGEERQ